MAGARAEYEKVVTELFDAADAMIQQTAKRQGFGPCRACGRNICKPTCARKRLIEAVNAMRLWEGTAP